MQVHDVEEDGKGEALEYVNVRTYTKYYLMWSEINCIVTRPANDPVSESTIKKIAI